MNAEVRFILSAVKNALTGCGLPEIAESPDWEDVLGLSRRHNIANLVGYGIRGCSGIPQDYAGEFKKEVYTQVFISENQQSEIRAMLDLFDEYKIDYMPFKGLVLKDLYPSSDMRAMHDADILIKPRQFDAISSIMHELKYTYLGESNHEFMYFKAPVMRVELHKHLIPSYDDDMYQYYCDAWRMAQKDKEKDNLYYMSVDDEYVYAVTHLAKHYRDSGIGIRPFVDIWLCRAKLELDSEYVDSQLELLKLRDFHDCITGLLDVWFGEGESSPLFDEMTEFIVNSGAFGTKDNASRATLLRENESVEVASKLRYFHLVFPKYKHMKLSFPVLDRCPVLLPFLWVYRWLRCIFFRRKNIEAGINNVKGASKKNVRQFDAHIKSVGLDIYNGRKK